MILLFIVIIIKFYKMTATTDESCGKLPKNEAAFPLCRATDSL